MLGAFGLGAKSALATRCDYYTVNSVHNGRKVSFNCYAHKIDSLISRFNSKTGEKNPTITLGKGTKEFPKYVAHYELTDEKNYTEIIVPFKRHNRQRLQQAVKNQLLYFDNVEFIYIREDGTRRDIPFKAKVLHNSESIIISDTHLYSRPHIIVVKDKESETGICYGTIDWEELDMESRRGSIGFKVPIRSVVTDDETGKEEVVQDGISVVPSRESVIWDDHTRNYIQKVIAKAQKEASELVEKELQEDGFFQWLRKCSQIINKARNLWGPATALSTISKLIDSTQIKPVYPKDQDIVYDSSPEKFLWGLNPKKVRTKMGQYNRHTGKYTMKIEREVVNSWSEFNPEGIYLLEQAEVHKPITDKYLIDLHGGSFVTIKKDDDEQLLDLLKEKTKHDKNINFKKYSEEILSKKEKIYKLFKEKAKKYSEVEVPEDFGKAAEEDLQEATLSPAELREAQEKTVSYTGKLTPASYSRDKMVLTKVEPKIEDLNKIEKTVYYSVQENDDMLRAACVFNVHRAMKKQNNGNPIFFNTDLAFDEKYNLPLFVRFSKRNLKYIKDNKRFIPINQYFYKKNTKDMKHIGDPFIPYFTAERIKTKIDSLKFLYGFEQFNSQVFAVYNFLTDYIRTHYEKNRHRIMNDSTFFNFFQRESKKLGDLQILIAKGGNEEHIKQKALELAGDGNIRDIHAVDITVIQMMEELEEYCENVKDLFNQIEFLTNPYATMTDNAKRIISNIIDQEGLSNFKFSKKTLETIKTHD